MAKDRKRKPESRKQDQESPLQSLPAIRVFLFLGIGKLNLDVKQGETFQFACEPRSEDARRGSSGHYEDGVYEGDCHSLFQPHSRHEWGSLPVHDRTVWCRSQSHDRGSSCFRATPLSDLLYSDFCVYILQKRIPIHIYSRILKLNYDKNSAQPNSFSLKHNRCIFGDKQLVKILQLRRTLAKYRVERTQIHSPKS